MNAKLHGMVRALLHRPSYVFLTGSDAALSAREGREFRWAWLGVMGLSLLWGLASMGIWQVCYALLGRTAEIPSLLPAMATATVFCAWPYRRGVMTLAHLISPLDVAMRSLILALLGVGLVGCFLGLRGGDSLSDFWLPWYVQWLRPFEKHYRVLLVAPLWGAWAMMIAPKFCKGCVSGEAATSAFAAGCGPIVAAGGMLLPLGASLFYFNFLGWWQLLMTAITGGCAVVGSIVLCRVAGGLTRSTLLAVNVMTQVAFLLSYLAARNLGV